MVTHLKRISRGLSVALCLAAGLLSIANMDDALMQDHGTERARVEARLKAKANLSEQLARSEAHSKPSAALTAFHQSLQDDELGDENPFANLSAMDPLQQITAKGIRKFSRHTFRSPEYNHEFGYDLIHYEVKHPDGTQSSVLAYVERTPVIEPTGEGKPSAVAVVLFLVPESGENRMTLFREGSLTETDLIPGNEAQTLVAQRIKESVPFLSVSR